MKRIFTKLKIALGKRLKPRTLIPSYEEKRAVIDSYLFKTQIKYFVETGTFLGDTVAFFKDKFEKVFSIELNADLAKDATDRFKGDENVSIIHGDSGRVLEKLVKDISAPTFYWLDGHYSSEFYVGSKYVKTARADKDTPVLKELEVLLNDGFQHLILVDDARLFNGEGDYPTITQIRKLVSQSNFLYQVFVEKDIIHIIPENGFNSKH